MIKNLKKGEILIYAIALMLVAAGYLNYQSNNVTEETYSEDIANIGDAVLVNSNDITEEENEANNEENDSEIVANNTDPLNNENTNKTGNNENTQETISNNTTTTEEDYFVNSKLERDTMYANMTSSYMSILENQNIDETQKSIANQEIQKINNNKNKIMICENLLETKGFEKCVIFINSESVNIIIGQTEDLKTEQVAQIQNIISREMSTNIENIHIAKK